MARERILVIRLGALGDLVLCGAAFQAIRRQHAGAEIALLTMPGFAAFARTMPWFDRVLTDERAPGWRVDKWLGLRRRVRDFAPTRVYDLQGKTRQGILYALLGGPLGMEWSGAAPLCSHPRLWPPQPGMHFTDFVAAQLNRAGITEIPPADWSWLAAPVAAFGLPSRYALLIPGCGPGRAYKRWPASHYAALAGMLEGEGIASAAIGAKADADATAALARHAPHVIDLTSRTSLAQLASLARGATFVIGNDTGPTHLCAAAGAPTLTLFSPMVNPAWSAPKGPRTAVLQGHLPEVTAAQVSLALGALRGKN